MPPDKNPDRSCRICGFMAGRETTHHSGYCLYFDDKGKPGESLKLPSGEEKETAASCKSYFRKVPELTTGEFLQWRLGIDIAANQHRMKRLLDLIAVLAFIVEAIHLYVAYIGEK